MKDCDICFGPLSKVDKKYSCSNYKCDSNVCDECIEDLINYSEDSDLLPKCPIKECESIYILSNLKGLPNKVLDTYYSACLKNILKDHKDEVVNQINEKKILDKIRNERIIFLEKEYPLSISLVAKIAFKNKLSKLNKQKVKLKTNNSDELKQKCPGFTCSGFLNKNGVCILCDAVTCNVCKGVKNESHKCNKEDIETVTYMNKMVKCPGCFLPVLKSEGCDSITCSFCTTNFLYSTGEIGGHGSSNIQIKTIEIRKLSDEYKEWMDGDCMSLLLQLESIEPKPINENTIITPLKSYIENGDNDLIVGKKIARKMDEYFSLLNDYKLYQIDMQKIEKILIKHDIVELKNTLTDFIKRWNKVILILDTVN